MAVEVLSKDLELWEEELLDDLHMGLMERVLDLVELLWLFWQLELPLNEHFEEVEDLVALLQS